MSGDELQEDSSCYSSLDIAVRPAGLTLAFQLQRRPCAVTAGSKRQFAQNQKDTPPGYGLQVRLGALVHAIGNGAASPAVLKVQAPSAAGASQVQHYCHQRWLLGHEALRDVGNCCMQPQKFPIDSRSRTWFSYFRANICMGSAHRNSDPRSVLEYRCKSTCKMDLLCDCSRRGI